MTTGPAATGNRPPAGPVQRGDNWTDYAACLRLDPDFMFSGRNRGEAIHICLLHCPVLRQCRAYAKALVPAPTDCVMGGIAWRLFHDRASDLTNRPLPTAACRLCTAGEL